ncbi:MAG: GNAT family N-acetyltransferase [Spirochaetia bacterium]
MSENIMHDERNQRFFVPLGDEEAEMTYRQVRPELISFNHTYVPPSHRGSGIAGRIVKEALEWAKGKNAKIVPSCSFVKAFVDKHPEYQEISTKH